MTVDGCCDKVDITDGHTNIMFGKHRFKVTVVHCKNCGSVKSRSHVKHLKEELHEH